MPLLGGYRQGIADAQRENANVMQANSQGLQQLSGLEQLMQGQQQAPLKMDLLRAQVADMQAKPEDRRIALENARQAALGRLTQQAGQFETTMGLKLRQVTNAEEKAAWDREYQQGRLMLEQAAKQQGADRLFYDTGMRSGVPNVAGPAPQPAPAAPVQAGGLEQLLPQPNNTRASLATIPYIPPAQRQQTQQNMDAGLKPDGSGPAIPASAVLTRASQYGPEGRFAPAGAEAPVAAAGPAAPAAPQMPQFQSPRARDQYLAAQGKLKITGNENSPGDFTKTGDAFLQTIPENERAFIKKVASYEIDPKTLSVVGGNRERALKMASAYDPTYDQKNYGSTAAAITRFNTGKQGDTVRSLNVAIEHMDTARRMADALKNGDVQIFNRVANEFAKQTGSSVPTNFEAVREIVANEVVKGVIGGPGALNDRIETAEKIRAANSPAQLNGAFDSWTELLSGQVKGLERQYEGATRRKDFRERFLTERTRKAVDGASTVVASPTAAQGGAWDNTKELRYQELLRKRGGT